MAETSARLAWVDLPLDARPQALADCRLRACAVQDRLDAFTELDGERPVPVTGRLAGLPYAVKDMIVTAGRRPACGLSMPPALDESSDAPVITCLEQAGAVRIGFTRMTALAYEPSGVGTARNPWNTAFAPGGSSAGSAVAVATGAAVVALGSDTGGSVRIPAQCCGVTAWKPSAGQVPGKGTMPLAPSLDTIGVIARTVRDIAAVAEVLTGGSVVSAGGMAACVAVAEDALSASEEAVAKACRAGLARLADIGVLTRRVEALDVVGRLGEEALLVMQAEAWRQWRHAPECAGDPVLSRRMAKGAEISDDRLARSLAARDGYRDALEQGLLNGADVLVLPVMPVRTPTLAEVDPASPAFAPRTLYALSAYTRFANYLGLPAVALPVGLDDRGLPVALQLVGRAGDDALLLATAARLRSAIPWDDCQAVEPAGLPVSQQ